MGGHSSTVLQITADTGDNNPRHSLTARAVSKVQSWRKARKSPHATSKTVRTRTLNTDNSTLFSIVSRVSRRSHHSWRPSCNSLPLGITALSDDCLFQTQEDLLSFLSVFVVALMITFNTHISLSTWHPCSVRKPGNTSMSRA